MNNSQNQKNDKHPLKVAKFGGTSMGSALAITRSMKLALKEKAQVIVVSATSGTTQKLLDIYREAGRGDMFRVLGQLEELREHHWSMARELGAHDAFFVRFQYTFDELFQVARGLTLLKEQGSKGRDRMASYGEILSSELAFLALEKLEAPQLEWRDVRTLVVTSNDFGHGLPLLHEIKKRAEQLWPNREDLIQRTIVTQGFIGQTREGDASTLGRGGSDFSGALIAEALNADVLQIWTDVPGMATTDPRICPEARAIPEMSFREAEELAIFGAKVLHPSTLGPAARAGLDVYVGSSFAPEKGGTWIRQKITSAPGMRAVALRRDVMLVTLANPRMVEAYGFLAKIFETCARHKISIDAVTTSEISVAFTVGKDVQEQKAWWDELEGLGSVTCEEKLGVVSLIGNGVYSTPGLAGQIFSVLHDIPIRMICLGASQHNFCLILNEELCEEALLKLHAFFLAHQSERISS
jgi:aspartate kinase